MGLRNRLRISSRRSCVSGLSLIVITKNESRKIARCLSSVPFAQQIVVVDSGSTDGTREIAESLGAEVIQTPDWPGFGPQKNRALDLAQASWVLSLDADEFLSPQLQAEIEAVLKAPQFDVYEFPRLSSYCGQFMRHSGWYPDHVLRLFRRGQARFSDEVVHERLIAQGRVGRLRSPLMHESFDRIEDVLSKLNSYSSAGAQKLAAAGQTASLRKAVFRGCWAFFRTYILRRGFLDGRRGFLLAVSNAEGTYYRYVKLWLLGQGASSSKLPR